jgi:hypothetical protein
MGRAIATTEAKAEKAEAKRIAKQLAKAVLDATPEASKVDHAVAVRIEAKEDASRLVDNGCTAGMKLFSMTNLAMRMTDLCSCFEFDLYDL